MLGSAVFHGASFARQGLLVADLVAAKVDSIRFSFGIAIASGGAACCRYQGSMNEQAPLASLPMADSYIDYEPNYKLFTIG